jgi:hypothetical protein
LAFNPSKESIKLASLNKLHDDAHAVLDSVKAAKTVFDNATNDRETSFAPLKKLSTKIVNALAATGASKLTLDDASSINFKIQGRRNGKRLLLLPAKTARLRSLPVYRYRNRALIHSLITSRSLRRLWPQTRTTRPMRTICR